MNYRQADATSSQQADIFVSSEQMTQLLLDGVLEQIAKAKVYMQRGDLTETSSHISWAFSIMNSLRLSLTQSSDAKFTRHVTELYATLILRLLEANLSHNEVYLDQVTILLKHIKCAWGSRTEQA